MYSSKAIKFIVLNAKNRDVSPWAFNERRSVLSAMLVGKKLRVTMVVSCSIVNCTNRARKGTKKKFYRIPKVIRHQGKQVEELTERRLEHFVSEKVGGLV